MSGAASLDLRRPIGGLFTALGVVIGGYGIATNGNAMYETSLSININLWWGIVMLIVSGLVGVASVIGSLGIREKVRSYFVLLLLAQSISQHHQIGGVDTTLAE